MGDVLASGRPEGVQADVGLHLVDLLMQLFYLVGKQQVLVLQEDQLIHHLLVGHLVFSFCGLNCFTYLPLPKSGRTNPRARLVTGVIFGDDLFH